ncbi:hypothetical protein K504DRAFT_178320 [Pleomassaria siparia CBS 279.74]|uniref:Uncharacterized protein n=1 Tax=Pleomassaria siparia CBS 279.74 TaxID=1314801 RepID=A0A6G1JS59_9PLEO|nr:hypothetical protein K504DRAFT_178320 [Pleomassaria siparia CBS 279.74]
MVDLAVSTQLQQWVFEKPSLARPERSDSSASSPDLYHNDSETLRIRTAAMDNDSKDQDSKSTLSFQERYLSSEEDLSPLEGDSDSDNDNDHVSIHEAPKKEYLHARKMSISKVDKEKSCDMAVLVSYTSAGRPKMINLDLTMLGSEPAPLQRPQRSASLSLAQLPITAINKLHKVEQSSRHSMITNPTRPTPLTSRSASPAVSVQSRKSSLAPTAVSPNDAPLSSAGSSFAESTTRSSSPRPHEKITRSFTDGDALSSMPWTSNRRPASSAAMIPSTRSSLYLTTTATTTTSAPSKRPSKQPTASTPLTPDSHSFLSSDPYERSTVTSASPILKSSPHKRLRSISQKLSMAKIAITPSSRKWDTRLYGKSINSPSIPPTPNTPLTPQTAPLPSSSSSSTNRLQRNSRISLRPASRIGSPDMPPMPSLLEPQPRSLLQKLVPRGANEREPMLELPPFPAEEVDPSASLKARRIRKRKSLMDLL